MVRIGLFLAGRPVSSLSVSEVVRVAHGSLYVDGLRDTLIVTLDADHELGGHSLCIPLSLGGASII